MTIWYINADTGNDSTGSGTPVSPWKTLGKANSATSNGDTIFCQNAVATYTFNNSNPGTLINAITITGQSVAGAVLDGGLGSEFNFTNNASGTITISNLTMQNADFQFIASIAASISNFVNIFFNTINYDNAGYTIFVPNNSGGNTINIQGCVFNNCGNHIGVNFGTNAINYLNCTSYIQSGGTAYNIVRVGTGGTTTVNLTNCIFFNNSGSSVRWWEFADVNAYAGSNNDFLGYTSTPSLTGNISADPLFVDAASLNFNLQPPSPCIGTGTVI